MLTQSSCSFFFHGRKSTTCWGNNDDSTVAKNESSTIGATNYCMKRMPNSSFRCELEGAAVGFIVGRGGVEVLAGLAAQDAEEELCARFL